ncbi:MAG: hypothetical protein ACRD3W_22815 [Terriglobales bacterium]
MTHINTISASARLIRAANKEDTTIKTSLILAKLPDGSLILDSVKGRPPFELTREQALVLANEIVDLIE